jgi:hypothetical protein
MTRRNLPAPGAQAVKAALDAVRVTLRDIGRWLKEGPGGTPVSPATLNNYRHGRREMPPAMRRRLAQQLVRQANRVKSAARRLSKQA